MYLLMYNNVDEYLKQKRTEKFTEEYIKKAKLLINEGLYHVVYSPDNVQSSEYPFEEYDATSGSMKHYKKVPMNVTNDEFEQIKKYSTIDETPKKNGVGIWALIIILILLSPILIPLAIAVGFFAVAIIFGILCIFPFAFFSGVSMWLGGAGMILKSFFAHAGFANMVMQIGVGCIFFGLGLFIAWATVVVCIKLFPWIIRKIVALGSRLFNKKA